MEVVAGKGIRAFANDVKVSVGNEALMAEDAPDSSFPSVPLVEHGSICCIAADGVVVGVITVSDTVRNDARKCLQSLKKMGFTTGMLTGVTHRFLSKLLLNLSTPSKSYKVILCLILVYR